MHLFNLKIKNLIIRFFLFMAIVLAGAYLGLPWWLNISLGMLVFLSGLFGIRFRDFPGSDRSHGNQKSDQASQMQMESRESN